MSTTQATSILAAAPRKNRWTSIFTIGHVQFAVGRPTTLYANATEPPAALQQGGVERELTVGRRELLYSYFTTRLGNELIVLGVGTKSIAK